MDALLPEIKQVGLLCRLLEEHNGGEVVALDLRSFHIWTDFFIIANINSNTHLQGMLRHVKEFAVEQNLAILRGQRKDSAADGWNIIDMGTAVIHLMSAKTREFYELEELWLPAERIFP
jgi:ribosome-associated protein